MKLNVPQQLNLATITLGAVAMLFFGLTAIAYSEQARQTEQREKIAACMISYSARQLAHGDALVADQMTFEDFHAKWITTRMTYRMKCERDV